MGRAGFVYVLINQSLPGCVKIGKTTRDTAARAAELSAATGVPTPFLIAYDAYFNDCDEAEAYVHALLESAGARLAVNREFFTLGASEAINAVIQAQQKLGSKSSYNDDGNNARFDNQDEAFEELEPLDIDFAQQHLWEHVLSEAVDYDRGYGDVLADRDKAIELYKIAAKLGSLEAHVRLGELYAESGAAEKGLEWLKRGADRGYLACWIELATVFLGKRCDDYYSDIPHNKENAIKCFRRFFELIDPAAYDPGGSQLYTYLKDYLALLDGGPSARDTEVLDGFITKFRAMLSANPEESAKRTKLGQLDALLGSQSKTPTYSQQEPLTPSQQNPLTPSRGGLGGGWVNRLLDMLK